MGEQSNDATAFLDVASVTAAGFGKGSTARVGDVDWVLIGDADPSLSLGVLGWTHLGREHVSVIVKATYSFDPGERPPGELVMMKRIAADPLHIRDHHHRRRPVILAPSDLVPRRHLVDVVMNGDAHAPGGTEVTDMRVRLALMQHGGAAIDKTLRVVADAPFATMPLGWDRAYGGIGVPLNPIGLGHKGEPPNVLHHERDDVPAGYGAIAPQWPARKNRAKGEPLSPNARETLVLPEQMDWGYFQCAPDDQQLEALAPDAILVLEGMHATHASLRACLPGEWAAAAVYGLNPGDPDGGHTLPLAADTLCIDAERCVCSVVWRGAFELARREHLPSLSVAVAVAAEPVVFPGSRGELRVSAAPASQLTLGPSKVRGPTLPFAAGTKRPRFTAADEPSTMGSPKGGTLGVSSTAETRAPLPFGSGADGGNTAAWAARLKGTPAASATASAAASGDVTLGVGAHQPSGPALPFAGSRSPAPVAGEVASLPAKGATIGPAGLMHGPVPAFMQAAQPAPAAPRRAAPAAPAPTHAPNAARFFHDVRSLPKPEPIEPARRASAKTIPPLPILEVYAAISAKLHQPGSRRALVLAAQEMSHALWRRADKHWKKELADERKKREHTLRDRFDDAYVATWDALNPGCLDVAARVRLLRAREGGTLDLERELLGIDAVQSRRFIRVFKRRLEASAELRAEVARLEP